MWWRISAWLYKNFPDFLTVLQKFTILEWLAIFGVAAYAIFQIGSATY